MEALFAMFQAHGLTGAIIAVLLYMVIRLEGLLVRLVENNTKALAELKGIIDKCQTVHGKG